MRNLLPATLFAYAAMVVFSLKMKATMLRLVVSVRRESASILMQNGIACQHVSRSLSALKRHAGCG